MNNFQYLPQSDRAEILSALRALAARFGIQAVSPFASRVDKIRATKYRQDILCAAATLSHGKSMMWDTLLESRKQAVRRVLQEIHARLLRDPESENLAKALATAIQDLS